MKYHQRELVDSFRSSLPNIGHEVLESHQRELVDSFRSNLTNIGHELLETHQRELVDCSDPTYVGEPLRPKNSPNGSWGIVQIQPLLDTEFMLWP